MEITKETYIQALSETIDKVEALRRFTKRYPILYYSIPRANGKTQFAYRFIKHYSSIIRAYEEAEKEARGERPGFLRRLFKKRQPKRTRPSPLLVQAAVEIYGLTNIDGRSAEQIVELILKKERTFRGWGV